MTVIYPESPEPGERRIKVTLTEFLSARLDEYERDIAEVTSTYFDAPMSEAQMRADLEAKRRIVELHESWPVLVETPPSFDMDHESGANSVAFRASQQIAWMTTQEYRARFGDEPPTTPILRILATVYADHPDYREEWRP